jgi:hypothetical protein
MAVTYCVALPFIRIADHSGADGLLRLVLDAAEKAVTAIGQKWWCHLMRLGTLHSNNHRMARQ